MGLLTLHVLAIVILLLGAHNHQNGLIVLSLVLELLAMWLSRTQRER